MHSQTSSSLVLFSLLGTSALAAAEWSFGDSGRWQSYGNRWRHPTLGQSSSSAAATTMSTAPAASQGTSVAATEIASTSTPDPTTLVTSTVAAADPSTSATSAASQISIPTPTGLSLTSLWLPDYETDDVPDVTNQYFIDTIMVNINNMRAAHDAAPLQWSADMANYAVEMEAKYPCTHTGDADRNGYGENLCMYSGPQWIATTGHAMQAWYDEWHFYNPQNLSTFYSWGHFSQMVWKDSTQIGCAWSKNPDCSAVPSWHTIRCLFNPLGNIGGQYTTEVTP